MGPTFLLLAALQISQPDVSPPAQNRPRLSIGAHVSGIAVNVSEGGHTGVGAGLSSVIPIGARTAIGLRVTHLFPASGFGVYEVRWHRMLKAPRNGKPEYLAAGIAGFYYTEIHYRNHVRSERRKLSYPQMLALATGWNATAGGRLSIPFEFGVVVHPYGLLAAHASAGVSWGPTRPCR